MTVFRELHDLRRFMVTSTDEIQGLLEKIYKDDSRGILATLIRLLGDFETAEDALQEAFASAVEQWAQTGIPVNPRSWLISAGRFKAIDSIRRQGRFESSPDNFTDTAETGAFEITDEIDKTIKDDELRLIFTCCHPALSPEARIALTLREVCDLTNEEIAHAFLTTPATLAQRIVRAKSKIRDAKISYQIPSKADLPGRLDAVLRVIYLVFNEGYSASSGNTITRADLSQEAIRLGRILMELLPEPEVLGLLGLMLLQESRRTARTTATGDLVLLEDQDRSQWNQPLIKEGISVVETALAARRVGPFILQAAIAAIHSEAPNAKETDWAEIAELYNTLWQIEPTPVIELNRAVAVAMRDGPQQGLPLIDAILERGELSDYHLAHAARAELCRRLGRIEEAKSSFIRALTLTRQKPEQRFLENRLKNLK